MKIIILGTAWPYRGGLATFNERLATQFAKEGHEVEVYTFTLQYPGFLFPGKTQYTNDPAPEGLNIVRRVNSCNPLNWISVGNEIRRKAPDMLITCYWMAFMAPCFGTIERIARRNKHTRCIALVHNMMPHEPSMLDKLFAPYFVKSTNGFVALSDAVVKDINKLDKQGKPKTFSPHPIYDHYGELLSKEYASALLGIDSDEHYLLFFGLVRAYKGLDLLLDAMPLLRNQLALKGIRLPKLLIAGEFYEDEEKYRNQIEQNGLTDDVIIRNEFIPDNEINRYFSACDMVVQPYKTATQSGVTQVAFHFNKPMLVTNVGGLGEIVHHGKMGYAVNPDAQAIADSLTDFYTEQREADFTDYVIQEKNKYNWDKLTAKFLEMYSC